MKNNRLVYILLCLLNLSWANARNKQQEAEALIKKSVEALYNNPKQASYYAAKVIELGSPDKPGGLSIQLCKSEKKEFYIRYSS